jgi:hypothetical protein
MEKERCCSGSSSNNKHNNRVAASRTFGPTCGFIDFTLDSFFGFFSLSVFLLYPSVDGGVRASPGWGAFRSYVLIHIGVASTNMDSPPLRPSPLSVLMGDKGGGGGEHSRAAIRRVGRCLSAVCPREYRPVVDDRIVRTRLGGLPRSGRVVCPQEPELGRGARDSIDGRDEMLLILRIPEPEGYRG